MFIFNTYELMNKNCLHNVISFSYVSICLVLCRGRVDMNEWIEAINLVAATYSSPPLPAPIGSWYDIGIDFCFQVIEKLLIAI